MSNIQPPLAVPSAETLDRFTSIVGESHALTAPEDQARYLTEWRGRYHGATPLVLRPGTTQQVADIVTLANQKHVGLVTQAGNTGLVGGQIARPSGMEVVLSVERLNRLRSLDADGRYMEIEAGVTLSKAQDYADKAGLLFPLRMASEGSACVGGAIATNAGGVHVVRYGSMRALTLGLEAVMANGEIWHGLRTLKKDNTGYDLKNLLIGSEGTLGVITAATLSLLPRPSSHAATMLGVESVDDIAAIFHELSDVLGQALIAFEFISRQALEFATTHIADARAPFTEFPSWAILIETASNREPSDAQSVLADALSGEKVQSLTQASALAMSENQRLEFWTLREGISEAQKHAGGSIKHDISLPISRIAPFLKDANDLVQRLCPGARPCPFGHFGDGNIHYNISQPIDADTDRFLEQWSEIQDAIHGLVVSYDGSISAEHGIGIMKRDALVSAKSAVELDIMRAIKAALDPNGILNPGKLL